MYKKNHNKFSERLIESSVLKLVPIQKCHSSKNLKLFDLKTTTKITQKKLSYKNNLIHLHL
jgi:hypothetical protein